MRSRLLASWLLAAAAAPAPAPVAAAVPAWRPAGHSTVARQEVAAARVGRYLYFAGGFEGSTPSTTVERYDPAAAAWKRVAPLPYALNHTAAVGHGGRLYVVGGYIGDAKALARSDGFAVAELLEYDPAADRWRELAAPPTHRGALGAAVAGGRLYAVGGFNLSSGELASTDVYDFATARWSAGPALSVPREHLSVVACRGRIYAIGGRADPLYATGNLGTVERLDPAAGRWETLRPLHHPRSAASAVAVAGRIFVFGGEESQGTIGETETIDARTGRRALLAPLGTPRHSMGAAAAAGRVYAVEGSPTARFGESDTVEVLDGRRSGHPSGAPPRSGGSGAARLARTWPVGHLLGEVTRR